MERQPMDYYTQLAVEALERAGFPVAAADRVPGLYDVAGLARDVTVGQLWQISQTQGKWNETAPIGVRP